MCGARANGLRQPGGHIGITVAGAPIHHPDRPLRSATHPSFGRPNYLFIFPFFLYYFFKN
jgi:hypothetical protein